MTTCLSPNRQPSTAYKDHGCRCPRCLDWKADYNARQRAARALKSSALRRRDDDGIVDVEVVRRLVAGYITPADATYGEAIEAARWAYGRDGWYSWCQNVLGLRSERIRRIAAEAQRGAA
jgi:hypothetical protein